ncbi:hypothetical protein GCM10009836_02070 [Pseudonocardia ailaonensis]|uniref:Uncharacterized protein n=1 Tax=Pseudonocardia ailaonensis TaxID=367279 RepID=A0ABN2MI11_9PSEU
MIATGARTREQVLDAQRVADIVDGLGVSPDFPLLHWAVAAPVLEPGTSLRLRLVHRVRPGDVLAVSETPATERAVAQQEIRVGGVLAVRTTTHALTVAPGAVPHDASPLDPAAAHRIERSLADAEDPAQVAARVATALGLSRVVTRSAPPVLGVYVDVHGRIDGVAGLRCATSTSAEGSAQVHIATADGEPVLGARVWFGCGPRW